MNTTASEVAFETLYLIREVVWRYIQPIILFVGTISNLLTIFVMSRKNMRRLNISIFLLCLGVSDLTVLYTGLFPSYFRIYNIYPRSLSTTACKLIPWLFYTSSYFSAWLLLLMTLDRFIAIYFPIQSRTKSRKYTSLLKVLSVLIFFSFINSHILYYYHLAPHIYYGNTTVDVCTIEENTDYYYFRLHYFQWIDFSFFFVIPFVVLITCNGGIIWKLKTMASSLKEGQNQKRKQIKANTKLILLVNMVFLITTMPVCITVTMLLLFSPFDSEFQEKLLYLMDILAQSIMFMGNSINFFLYLMGGRLIREEFLGIFCRKPQIVGQVSSTGQEITSDRELTTTTGHEITETNLAGRRLHLKNARP